MVFILYIISFSIVPTKLLSKETGFKFNTSHYSAVMDEFLIIHTSMSKPIKIIKTYHAKVSWYNYGKKTANGEKFNPNNFTVAHKHLPFGTLVKFTNTETNKSIVARVNDRGPFFKSREFDLTLKMAKILNIEKQGVATLKIEILG